MLVPLSWLKEYVDITDTVEGLRDKLTFSGLEVEGVETVGADLAGCVVARIESVRPHPNADKLRLCDIVFGAEAPLTVVCGAPNARPGLHAIFAPAGVTLPNGLKLEKRKVRGVESAGMLCAPDELGLPGGHDGLLELPESTAPGTPANTVLGGPEVVFDLEVTPNRPDCLSVVGIARELAALHGLPLRLPPVDFEESGPAPTARLEVRDPRCPRYVARELRAVALGPSPEWMQRRLTLAGVRPINNVVDVTNYVMLELGQPLHAFDLDRLTGGQVVVRPAGGQPLRTLDGRERPLPPETLIIADAERPVAVAGVMGGAESEISTTTTTVLLESAAFSGPTVRATAKALDLHTESSYRFARGCDVAGVDFASRRAVHLLARLTAASVAPGAVEHYPAPPPAREVGLRWQRLRDLVGLPASAEDITARLTALGLTLLDQTDGEGRFGIPSFRGDLEREVDLIEEYARLKGLEEIPTPIPCARIVEGAEQHEFDGLSRLRHRLAGAGLQEILNYSLTAPAALDTLAATPAERRIVLPNPISADQSVLRTDLLPQMLETLARNKARQIDEVAFFELGKVFQAGASEPSEAWRLAIGLLGPVGRPPLARRAEVTPGEMLSWIKAWVERLEPAPGAWRIEAADSPGLRRGHAARLWQGEEEVGRFGLLAPALGREHRLLAPVGLLEIGVGDTFLRPRAWAKAPVLPAHPCTRRDVALKVDPGVTHRQILDVIRAHAPRQLESVDLFDVFADAKLGGKKSMAYAFTYRDPAKTLTDEEANSLHATLTARLREKIPAEIVGEA
jgi:phenylalanyl-tRNA synthetase beta chain